MIAYTDPVSRLIRRRFSCRTYSPQPIEEEKRRRLEEEAAAVSAGPLGGALRVRLIAASAGDPHTLRGLGTYGFIRGAAGFLVGAVLPSERHLEEYGYRLEELVLLATDLGLGSCWLGGTFRKSRFAVRISRTGGEEVPAVVAVGRIPGIERARKGLIRRFVGAENRLPPERLFFNGSFHRPLRNGEAGGYAKALEMVRLAPSASNKQPWRILRTEGGWHFFLRRDRGYRAGFLPRMLRIADLQRIDMGIAMCHFALTAKEVGLQGRWIIRKPSVGNIDNRMEYCASWLP